MSWTWDKFLDTYSTVDAGNEALQDTFNVLDTAITGLSKAIFAIVPMCEQEIHPSISAYFVGQKASFSAEEQAILAYYSPFASDIQRDLALAEACMGAILKVSLQIKHIPPFEEAVSNLPVLNDGWRLDMSARLGGKVTVPDRCFEITINHLTDVEIPQFLPPHATYHFLNKGLCPLFLGEKTRCRLRLVAKTPVLTVSDNVKKTFWNIHSALHPI